MPIRSPFILLEAEDSDRVAGHQKTVNRRLYDSQARYLRSKTPHSHSLDFGLNIPNAVFGDPLIDLSRMSLTLSQSRRVSHLIISLVEVNARCDLHFEL